MILIGLNGRKGSGKDTVGKHLVDQHGFTRMAFADLLKQSAGRLFGINALVWEDMKNDPLARVDLYRGSCCADDAGLVATMSAREFLQRYGTEAHRDVFGEDFWVNQLFDRPQFHKADRVVITDARFENELRAVRRLGGINVRIERPDTDTDDEHRSEAEPADDLIDGTIYNGNTLAYLRAAVDRFVTAYAEEVR